MMNKLLERPNPRTLAAFAVVATASMLTPAPAQAGCTFESGASIAALVELYTSEGCSSCPPADRALGQLPSGLDTGAKVVPLALHVTYWDYIGWKDPFAQAAFDRRQDHLVRAGGQRTLYTPQVFVGGTELRLTHRTLRDEVRRLNATPAEATIRVSGSFPRDGILALDAYATARPRAGLPALYVAVAENQLVSQVSRGENAGATLEHTHVVRAWIGPLPLATDGVRVRRDIAIGGEWNRQNLEVVAFVQNESNGQVLQAVANRCRPDSSTK